MGVLLKRQFQYMTTYSTFTSPLQCVVVNRFCEAHPLSSYYVSETNTYHIIYQ